MFKVYLHVYVFFFQSRLTLKLTVEELITNLKMLVRQSIVRDNLDESDKHVLVGKRVKHRFDTNGEDQWYTGKVISQVQIYHKIATKPI